jgi:hypothetical protein
MPKSRYGSDRSKRVQDFIKEINKLCKTFKLSISHEDQHGGFEITDYDDCYTAWMGQAADKTKENS